MDFGRIKADELDDDFDGDYESQPIDNLKNAFARGRKISNQNDLNVIDEFHANAQICARGSMVKRD